MNFIFKTYILVFGKNAYVIFHNFLRSMYIKNTLKLSVRTLNNFIPTLYRA